MDGKRFNPDSNYMHMLRKCGRGVHGGIGMSEFPDEIIVVILSFLSLREAAATSVLSSRWLNLWKGTPNLKSDRISQLPDSIIIHILSFLPLKTAVATSILSSRWSDMWKHTANLDFRAWNLKLNLGSQMEMFGMEMEGDLWEAERCKYTELVNSVIQLHKGPSVKRFYLSFYVNKSAHLQVAKWLEFVFSRGVQDLDLAFQCYDPEYKVVLEELLRESGLCSPQTLICFNSLKILCLNFCRVSGEAIDVFLRNCPLLESLIIAYSDLTSGVEVCGTSANPLMLKHLEVYGCDGSSVKVSAPNLTRLKFGYGTTELFLENVPRLVEADFRFRSLSLDVVRNVAAAMLCFSSQLKILNLTLRHPKVFLMNGFPEMPNLRKLVVEYDGVSTHSLLPVTALIWSSPRLEEFKLMFRNKMDNGDAALIQVRRNGERCDPHLHLKLFELAGFVRGAGDHIELVSYIADNCVALEKIIIDTIPLKAFSVRTPLILVDRSLSEILNEREMEKQFVSDYVKQELQGKLPQHIQLEFV